MTSTLRDLVDAIQLPDPAPWTDPPRACHEHHDVVILVPPDGDIERAVRVVEDEVRAGKAVLLIARGVTLDEARRGRLHAAIAVAELDSYLPNDKTPLLAALREPLSDWLRASFEGAVPDVPVEKAFWSSAMMRFLRAPVAAAALALGIARRHGSDHLIITEDWVGLPTLERAFSMRGGRLARAWTAPWRVPFSVAFGAHWAVSLAGALATRTLEFSRQSPARRRFFELRSTGMREQPRTWITLTGHWPHSCRHVIESVARAASARGEPIGVLLQYAIEAGAIEGGLRTQTDPTTFFPALRHPDVAPALVAVDQCASAESWSELARVMVRATHASTRVGLRLLRQGAKQEIGPIVVDASRDIPDLARLATIDILRAEEARSATSRLIQRRAWENARIAFSHASLAQVCIPDLLLQSAGAETFDVVHGALAEALDMITSARTFSATKLFWTREEARYTAALMTPQRCLGGTPSRSLACSARRDAPAGAPLRVLALTNYGTRTGDRLVYLPRVAYQQHFFAALNALHDLASPYELRWRPHPGDDRDAVASTMQQHRALVVELSPNPSLDDDLAWADVVITSVSSVVVEALVHPVAVFVHGIPVHEAAVILSMFDRSRLFRDRPSLAFALHAYASARASDSARALDAERALRVRFFGPSEQAGTVADLLLADPSPSTISARETR